MIRYRNMTEDDIPAGLSLCRAAGWNQLDLDWKIFLALSRYGNRVAIDDDNKVAGTVTTITYDDKFSWIGMVLVEPAMKRQGIGTQLLREALDLLKDQETIKLDATPAGREVYLKLGFQDEYGLARMTGNAAEGSRKKGEGKSGLSSRTERSEPEGSAEKQRQTIESILTTDEHVFGASRKNLLESYSNQYPELTAIRNSSNYCFGRKGHNFTQIGPVIANSVDDAIDLSKSVMAIIEGPVVLDVMENSPFAQWLASIGFRQQRSLIRMYKGTNAHPGIPEKQFAILGPEFG